MVQPADPDAELRESLRGYAREVAGSLPSLIRQLARADESRRRQPGVFGVVSLPQYVALGAIRGGPITVSGLAEQVGVGVSSATRMVQGLERLGYVTSSRGTGDRRQKHVRLSGEGEQAYLARSEAMVTALTYVAANLDQNERAALLMSARALDRALARVLEEHP